MNARTLIDLQQPAAAPLQPVPAAEPAARGLAITLDRLAKRYDERPVLDEIALHIDPGEFVALVGRSGCGKSTLLRLIAGLDAPSAGAVRLDDGPARAAHADVRIMFQDARLLPWKRVLDNVALGLDGTDALQRARDALAQVGLADRADDWPAKLSGGQRQRVALARALAHSPRLLLLDEPLGALDALTRIEMHALIERLWRRHRFTAVLVTHDVTEAVVLSDRVLLIEDRRLAFNEPVPLSRPRTRTQPAFASFEEKVLRRVLAQPAIDAPAPVQAARLRWAI
jgi:sulfonate transport system ATP-binding protein